MTTLPPPSPGPDCPRYAPLLPLLHAGEISPRERDAVQRHLSTCDWCARQLASYDTLAAALRRHFGPAAPADLPPVETMLHDVTHREELVFEETPPRITPLTQSAPRRRTLPSIAATMLIVVLGLLLFVVLIPHHSAATHHKPTPTSVPTSIATLPVTAVNTAAFIAPGDVWIGGNDGLAHYAGGTWTRASLPEGTNIYGLSMLSATDGWAAGGEQNNSVPLLVHYSGGDWHQIALPFTGEPLQGIQMLSTGEGWAWASNILLHYTNRQWQPVTVGFDLVSDQICGVNFATPSEGWLAACGNSSVQFWRFHAGRWSADSTTAHATMDYFHPNISMVSADEGWAAMSSVSSSTRLGSTGPANPIILHYHNGQWTQENPDAHDLSSQAYFIDGLFLGQGQEGWASLFTNNPSISLAALHESAGKWSFVALPPNFIPSGFLSVGPGEAWAAGQSRTAPYIAVVAHYANGTWSIIDPN
jgi:hypothetical protein